MTSPREAEEPAAPAPWSPIPEPLRRALFSAGRSRGMPVLAWWIVLLTTFVTFASLVLFKTDPFRNVFGALLAGIGTTVRLVGMSMAGSLAIGAVVGLSRVSSLRPVNLAASIYVETVRGVPLLVLLFMTYYGLNEFLPIRIGKDFSVGTKLDAFWAAVVCFSLVYGAFIGEVVRAGIEAIPHEEIEAASLEGPYQSVVIHVILPRCFRFILPAVGNEFITLLKDSSIVAIIALNDITRSGHLYAQKSFLYFETFLMVALFYLGITLVLSRVVRIVETAWND